MLIYYVRSYNVRGPEVYQKGTVDIGEGPQCNTVESMMVEAHLKLNDVDKKEWIEDQRCGNEDTFNSNWIDPVREHLDKLNARCFVIQDEEWCGYATTPEGAAMAYIDGMIDVTKPDAA